MLFTKVLLILKKINGNINIRMKRFKKKWGYKMPTIKDVAKLSGTSVGTVSRYLNGYLIKETNRLKIEEAIKQLGFTLNPIARGLKTSKTNTVGILIPQLSSVFSTSIIEGMEQILDEFGYSVLVCDSRNSIDKEREKIRFLKDKFVDGIIIMPVDNVGDHIKEIIDGNLPVVLMDRLIDNLSCDAVISDSFNGAFEAVESIIKKGHKRIGMIAGPQSIYTAKKRFEGYKMALETYGLEVSDDLVVHTDLSQEEASQAFKRLINLQNPPTAIFTGNYDTTVGAVKSIIESDMVIGKDISIFGYDNLDLFKILKPQLSVVVQPMEAIGRGAAELLVKRMKGDFGSYPEIVVLKTDLMLTDSISNLT